MKAIVLTQSAVEFVKELMERRLILKSGVTSRDIDDLKDLGLLKDEVHKPFELTDKGVRYYWELE